MSLSICKYANENEYSTICTFLVDVRIRKSTHSRYNTCTNVVVVSFSLFQFNQSQKTVWKILTEQYNTMLRSIVLFDYLILIDERGYAIKIQYIDTNYFLIMLMLIFVHVCTNVHFYIHSLFSQLHFLQQTGAFGWNGFK